MQVQVDIGFDQLIHIVKELPAAQWTHLKEVVEKEAPQNRTNQDMEAFLLSAPTFTKKQFDAIAKTRKAINQWRTK